MEDMVADAVRKVVPWLLFPWNREEHATSIVISACADAGMVDLKGVALDAREAAIFFNRAHLRFAYLLRLWVSHGPLIPTRGQGTEHPITMEIILPKTCICKTLKWWWNWAEKRENIKIKEEESKLGKAQKEREKEKEEEASEMEVHPFFRMRPIVIATWNIISNRHTMLPAGTSRL